MKFFGTNPSKRDFKTLVQNSIASDLSDDIPIPVQDTKSDTSPNEKVNEPLASPAYEDVPIWNILPSYQLYQSTFSKNLRPSNEDLRYAPPTYHEDSTETPVGSVDSSTGSYFPNMTESPGSSHSIPAAAHSYSGNAINESPTRWEDSLLGNTHRLKKIGDINSAVANRVKIEIQITEKACKKGVRPTIIDPLTIEYQPGDSINGFITIRNKHSLPILFDMFSVVFEGKISVTGDTDSKKSHIFYKFLNMFDYSASWTPADLNDDAEENQYDPLDNACMRFPMEKYFEPGVTYKKFFNFRVPDKLLDVACEFHNLPRHCEMLPTLGLAKDQFLKNLRKFRQGLSANTEFTIGGTAPVLNQPRKPGFNGVLDKRLKDLSFPDTSVSYSVEARVIAKESDYSLIMPNSTIKSEKDEFLIVNESSCFIRLIPKERLSKAFDSHIIENESKIIYNNLVERVTQKIDLGKDLLDEKRTILNNEHTYEITRIPSISKRRQLYNEGSNSNLSKNKLLRKEKGAKYELFVPYKKKSLTAAPKVVGIIGLTTIKMDYKLKYVPPYKYRTLHPHPPNNELSTKLNIPLEFVFSSNESSKTSKPPDVKSISAELIVFTYRSKKYPIPVEIFSDLLFKNKPGDTDNIEHYVIKPFQKYLEEITDLSRKLSFEILNVDSQLIMDIKSLANLSTKYNCLRVDESKVTSNHATAPWTFVSSQEAKASSDQEVFSKKVNILVDLKNVFSKDNTGSHDDLGVDAYSLVPNFQSCIIGRAYYLRLHVKLQNNDLMYLRVPVTIQL